MPRRRVGSESTDSFGKGAAGAISGATLLRLRPIFFNFPHSVWLFQLGQRLVVGPVEDVAVDRIGLFVSFGLLKEVGVRLFEANPFNLLLKKAEKTARPGRFVAGCS